MTIELDPAGFNELRMCRSGPMLYNKNDAYIGSSLRKYGEWGVCQSHTILVTETGAEPLTQSQARLQVRQASPRSTNCRD